MKPIVIQSGLVDMQVCVPATFTDDEVIEFANRENPAGTEGGWSIRTAEDDPVQKGDATRVDCLDTEERSGCVHIMLVC